MYIHYIYLFIFCINYLLRKKKGIGNFMLSRNDQAMQYQDMRFH